MKHSPVHIILIESHKFYNFQRDVGRIGDGQEHLRDYFNSLEDIIVETEENIERCYDESDEDVDVNTCVNNVLQETRTAAKQVLYEMAQIDPQIAARVGLAIASCVSGFGFNLY